MFQCLGPDLLLQASDTERLDSLLACVVLLVRKRLGNGPPQPWLVAFP